MKNIAIIASLFLVAVAFSGESEDAKARIEGLISRAIGLRAGGNLSEARSVLDEASLAITSNDPPGRRRLDYAVNEMSMGIDSEILAHNKKVAAQQAAEAERIRLETKAWLKRHEREEREEAERARVLAKLKEEPASAPENPRNNDTDITAQRSDAGSDNGLPWKDGTGLLMRIAFCWIAPFCVSVLLMAGDKTKPIGIIIFLIWLFCFVIPNAIEGFALFIVLPGMIITGILKGIVKGLK